MKPFLKVGHRNGNVFLRYVHTIRGFRTATVAKMPPDEAEAIGRNLIEAARRARKEPATITMNGKVRLSSGDVVAKE